MKSRTCPSRNHCWEAGNCEACDYGKAYEKLNKKIKNLKKKNDQLKAENDRLEAFKEYFDILYGTGLEIAKWHENGSLEAFDNFYDAAMEEYEKSTEEKTDV